MEKCSISCRISRKFLPSPLTKGFEIQLQLDPKIVESTKQRAVRQAVDTIRNRVDQFGVAEPDVTISREDQNRGSIAWSGRRH